MKDENFNKILKLIKWYLLGVLGIGILLLTIYAIAMTYLFTNLA